MDIGYYIQRALHKTGLSQNELAARSGYTQSYISQIALNKKNPTIDTIQRLCTALSMTISDFFRAEPYPMPSPDVNTDALTEEDAATIRKFLVLDPPEKKIVTELVTMLSEHLRIIYVNAYISEAEKRRRATDKIDSSPESGKDTES